ncbi:MAG: GHKL domain-containing protein [Planctomycetaceae bacterium]|nr:GHKL domain-containing protein [Planctomycetaceae bacterium]
MAMSEQSLERQRDHLQLQYNEIASLAGGLAHEIRNPLSTIRLNLDLLSEDLVQLAVDPTHRAHRKLERIRLECEHLEEILNSFLEFARAGELHLEEVDLAEFVRKFLEFFKAEAEQAKIELRPHLAGSLPKVRLDPRLFRHVLSNLFKNAMQAMPNGGLIELQLYRKGDTVSLEVVDTGTGIAPGAVEKIFQVFFSTKPGGSGLGLPTVRKIVEAHQGTITCESEVGRGTKFAIHLPVLT